MKCSPSWLESCRWSGAAGSAVRAIVLALAAMLGVYGGARAQPGQPAAPAGAGVPAADSKLIKYVIVPIQGEFGAEVLAPAVRDTLTLARNKGCTYAVFLIDSPGGNLDDGLAVSRVLTEFDKQFQYTAIVRQSMGEANWVMAHCDSIFVLPQSTAGATVAYLHKQGSTTGAVEVDARLNSALAAQMAAIAEQHGHAGAIFTAMGVMEAELYLSKKGDAPPRVSSAPIGDDSQRLDNADTVLSLTGQQMVTIGLARAMVETADAAALGKLLGAPGWTEVPKLGIAQRTAAITESARLTRRRTEAIAKAEQLEAELTGLEESLNGLRDAARAAEPYRTGFQYDDRTGRPTAQSVRDWEFRVDAAIARWNDVLSTVDRAEQTHREAQKMLDDSARYTADALRFRRVEFKESDIEHPKVRALKINAVSERAAAGTQIDRLRSERSVYR